MAKRDRERAKVRRLALIQRLGGKCVDCLTTGGGNNPLEVDHVNGRDYSIRRMDQSWRVSVYEKEERTGVELACRCRRCNGRKH